MHKVIALLVLFPFVLLGQSFSDELPVNLEKNYHKAVQHARQQGEPLRFIRSDGRVSVLYGITVLGELIYVFEDNLTAARATGTQLIQKGGKYGFPLTGAGKVVGVWEVGTPNVNHIELAGRITQRDGGGERSVHATHVIGTVGASGINSLARGMAPEVDVWSYTSDNDVAELSDAGGEGLLISNHSYGFARGWSDGQWNGNSEISDQEDYLFGFYDGVARRWDQVAYRSPYLLMCKSAGNDRGDSGSGFPADCNRGAGFDCISHSGLSKNILTVGAINDINGDFDPANISMTSFSSWGPADDGRVKPDLVANGLSVVSSGGPDNDSYSSLSGTSMSSPAAAGSLLLIQQLYHLYHQKYLLSSSLKALAIHTARRVYDRPGPTYQAGWGLLDAAAMSQVIAKQDQAAYLIREDTLLSEEEREFVVRIDSAERAVFTLAWLDPAGEPVAPQLDPSARMLVNDLDLRVIDPNGNEAMPWVLDRNAPSQGAVRVDNVVDNVEKVEISDPVPGEYSILIRHKGDLVNESQVFSLVASSSNFSQGSSALFWVGESNDLLDSANWSRSPGGSGAGVMPGPGNDLIVDFESTPQADLQLNHDLAIHSLTILSSAPVSIELLGQSSIDIGGDFYAEQDILLQGIGELRLTGERYRSFIAAKRLYMNEANLVFDRVGTTVLEGSVFADSLIHARGELRHYAGDLSVNTWKVDESAIFRPHSRLKIEAQNIDYLAQTEGTLPFLTAMGVESGFNLPPSLQVGRLNNMADSLTLRSGSLHELENSGKVVISKVDTVTRLILNPGSSLIINQESMILGEQLDALGKPDSLIRISSINEGGSDFVSLSPDRVCMDYLSIRNVRLNSEQVHAIGRNSDIDESSSGWVPQDCENLLQADFSVSYPCTFSLTDFSDQTTGDKQDYLWEFGDGSSSQITNPQHNYAAAGIYQVSLKVSNSAEISSKAREVKVKENDLEQPEILISEGALISSASADAYQWYADSLPIQGAINRLYRPSSLEASFYLEISTDSCRRFSAPFVVTKSTSIQQFEMYPNPSNGKLRAVGVKKGDALVITDQSGRQVYRGVYRGEEELEVSDLSPGIYLAVLQQRNGKLIFKKLTVY